MPKAIRFNKLGGPENLVLEETGSRAPQEGEVKLRVEAVGLNRAESMYYHGFYFETPELPSGLGYEAAGVVTEVGAGVDPALKGKRFGTVPGYSMNKYPSLAEEAIVPAPVLAAVPEALSPVEIAAVWMQYGTAYGALVYFGKLQAGDAVIITAASSSVGLAAIQMVKAEGGTAIATTRTSAKKQELLSLGADHVIATEEEDLVARVMEITGGKGARLVFDPIAGPIVETLVKATATEGIVFEYGLLSGEPTPFPLEQALPRGISVQGYTIAQINGEPSRSEAMRKYIYERLADGRFKPKIARTFPLEQAREAYEFLESNQQVGKVVITVGDAK